jgi:hypothetical protein
MPRIAFETMNTLVTTGRVFYAIAIVAFGILHLASGGFVTRVIPWWPAWMPVRSLWAYGVGTILIAVGTALIVNRHTVLVANLLGCALLFSFLALGLPLAAADAVLGGGWTRAGKALALSGGAFLVAQSSLAMAAEPLLAPASFNRRVARLWAFGPLFFGSFLVLCGVQHFCPRGICTVAGADVDSRRPSLDATDNGATAAAVMEAMRILKAVVPRPSRTILAGLWSGEEQGFNGSRAFAQDHPEVARGAQAVFDHDNGTGRFVHVSAQGQPASDEFMKRWLSQVPSDIAGPIRVEASATLSRGIDAFSFSCAGAPAFSFSSASWEYETYTWHTDLDTFDKVVIDDVRSNAIVLAMLAYLASEDPTRLPRDAPPKSFDSLPRAGTTFELGHAGVVPAANTKCVGHLMLVFLAGPIVRNRPKLAFIQAGMGVPCGRRWLGVRDDFRNWLLTAA